MKERKILVVTGGGDCPGLNAVLRGIVKRAQTEGNWKVYGSIESFNGVLKEELEIVELTPALVSGIHVKGGTIIKTTNRGGPFHFPVKQKDGSWEFENRGLEMIERLEKLGFEAVINIGGDGSQAISLGLYNMGLPIVGVPKTIDNDLSSTDVTFGFQTAVQFATEALDRLVTTAESHNRIFILEVMGRNAGWIALHTAVAGGAEVCIIPEIRYNPRKILEKIESRYNENEGFCNIVIAEGAVDIFGNLVGKTPTDIGDRHFKLGGAGEKLKIQLEKLGVQHDIRVMVLGHLQRGGTPTAFDRILATQFGVKAFELVKEGAYGRMVTVSRGSISSVSLVQALRKPNLIKPKKDFLIKTAKDIGIFFGD